MKLLVIGSGGREHAMAWRLAKTEGMQKVYVAPGNAGTAAEPSTAIKQANGRTRILPT